jgi:hypothetical protein
MLRAVRAGGVLGLSAGPLLARLAQVDDLGHAAKLALRNRGSKCDVDGADGGRRAPPRCLAHGPAGRPARGWWSCRRSSA